jgi:hypothetical protein
VCSAQVVEILGILIRNGISLCVMHLGAPDAMCQPGGLA